MASAPLHAQKSYFLLKQANFSATIIKKIRRLQKIREGIVIFAARSPPIERFNFTI